jgi:TolB-like protein/predicted Ser/Thr protein kinase/cytochrome c-type biogenesis protein CcmH/NrfG
MTIQQHEKFLSRGSIQAGKYRIIEPIGKGGMGVVYKAEDIKLERIVAVKFLPAELTEDPEAKERFVREARAAAALSHNHICTIHEIGEEENESFIVMEYVEGQSLKEKIRKGALDQAEALDIAIQVAEGLEEAHKKGIVHRDIKPGNIMLTDKGTSKVMDFGLAKVLGGSLITKEAKTMGTVAYMSPEQAKGEVVDQRTDIWSLGVVLYEMLTGQLPFKGEFEQSMIHSILNHEPEPLAKLRPHLPKGLEKVVLTALAKNPADRYRSMDEFLEDLKALAEGLKPLRAKVGLLRGKILGIKKAYALAGLACLIVFIALAMIFLFPKRGQAYDSIAVLPLENLSGDPQQEYFSDGMHEALIAELSRIKAIKVISRTSVMGYKGTKKRIPEIAKELGVAAIVEGSTVRSGNIVRINVQLIDAQSDKHLWADNFDREYRDVLTLQSEAALAIAKEIQATLTPEELRSMGHKLPVNPDAYEEYLKGKLILDGMGFSSGGDMYQSLKMSLLHFEQALKIDSNLALAYAGIALVYDYYASSGNPVEEVVPKAREAALKALRLDNSLADAHLVLADIKFVWEWDYDDAVKEFEHLFELNPNHALAHAWYALDITYLGRIDEAVLHASRARKLDPLNSTIGALATHVYSGARQYDQALTTAQELADQNPSSPGAHKNLATAYMNKGQFRQADEEYQMAIKLGAQPDQTWLLIFYALSGEKSKAREILNEKLKRQNYSPYGLAGAYSLLGEKEKALEWLEKAYEARDVGMLSGFTWDSIRSDPRFKALLKKMGRADK